MNSAGVTESYIGDKALKKELRKKKGKERAAFMLAVLLIAVLVSVICAAFSLADVAESVGRIADALDKISNLGGK